MKFFSRLQFMIVMKALLGLVLFFVKSPVMAGVFWFGAFLFLGYYVFLKHVKKGGVDESFHFGMLHVLLSVLILCLTPVMYVANDPLSLVEVLVKNVLGFFFLTLGVRHISNS